MVSRRASGLVALSIAVAGCYDHFYGPKLTNAFGFDVLVTVYYDVGQSTTTEWPACRTVFFGSKQRRIEKLLIERDGKVLRTLTAAEVRDLAKALEDGRGRADWMVDSTGVQRVPGDVTSACKPTE